MSGTALQFWRWTSPGLIDQELERQFLVMCNMRAVRQKCKRQVNLNLDKVIEIALGYERVYVGLSKHATAMLTTQIKPIHHMSICPARERNAYQARSSAEAITDPDLPKCPNCGRLHHERASCPAKGTTCHNCHFARVCRSTQRLHDNNRRPSKYAEFMRYQNMVNYEIKALTGEIADIYQVNPNTSSRITVSIRERPIRMQIDSGSPVIFPFLSLQNPMRWFGER